MYLQVRTVLPDGPGVIRCVGGPALTEVRWPVPRRCRTRRSRAEGGGGIICTAKAEASRADSTLSSGGAGVCRRGGLAGGPDAELDPRAGSRDGALLFCLTLLLGRFSLKVGSVSGGSLADELPEVHW